MHESSLLRMQWFVDTYLDTQKSASVLDVGSYDVNGSYKQFFTGPRFTYTGLDMVSGPNVDYVLKNPYQWEEFPDAAYDVVVSGQTFEHTEFFWLTLAEMARVLRPGGGVVIHDYSVQGSTRAKAIWATICHGVIIPLAVIKRSDVPLHRYLYTSVRDFDSVARICERLLGAGMVDVRHRTDPGWQRDVIHTVGGSAPS